MKNEVGEQASQSPCTHCNDTGVHGGLPCGSCCRGEVLCDPPGACAEHGRCWAHSNWRPDEHDIPRSPERDRVAPVRPVVDPSYVRGIGGCGAVSPTGDVCTRDITFCLGDHDWIKTSAGEAEGTGMSSSETATPDANGVVMWKGVPHREGTCKGPDRCLACDRIGHHLEPIESTSGRESPPRAGYTINVGGFASGNETTDPTRDAAELALMRRMLAKLREVPGSVLVPDDEASAEEHGAGLTFTNYDDHHYVVRQSDAVRDQPGIDSHPIESFNGSRRGRWNSEIKRLRDVIRTAIDNLEAYAHEPGSNRANGVRMRLLAALEGK